MQGDEDHGIQGASAAPTGLSPSVEPASGLDGSAASIPSAVLGISSSACFFPEEDEPERFDGETITWTFEILKSEYPGPGLYKIELVRLLTAEERAEKSATLLASAIEARRAETAGLGAQHESAAREGGDAQ